ncbi:UvrD-helicase domain-containing protein [Aristophania vespae]|uniref:UvrD-helicase domain-containing protein n=1 Tax=Aristophania vespae TaxID=2697033 RepID=UPI00350E498E
MQNSSITQDDAIATADRAQRLASDPQASVFVSASAGSGKTKLLIDRLLRLMLPIEVEDEGKTIILEGTHPRRILCLTYTKAAAAEMASRLQSRLGKWVTLSDEALGQELDALAVPNTEKTRASARGLFIKVLDLPGGLRIETIHAFCQSLLRRFPLEAALDPHFSLIEETEGRLLLNQAFESEIAAHPEKAVSLAGQVSLETMLKILGKFIEKSEDFSALMKRWSQFPHEGELAYRELLNLQDLTLETLEEQDRFSPFEKELIAQFELADSALTAKGRDLSQPLLDWLRQPPAQRQAFSLDSVFMTKEQKPKKMNLLVCKAARELAPELLSLLEQEAKRRYEIFQAKKAFELITLNKDLLALSLPLFARFQTEKNRRGSVDYGDLITRTRMLLRDPGAAWVLYKLDGGIEHLLLDEVQDTSGLQWEIAGALTSEFFSGEGAHEALVRPRTIFAVGDFKQSIYSFQGAEPEQFHKWRKEFALRVKRANLLWREPELNVSFRSVTPVLTFVDEVFASEIAAKGLVEEGSHAPARHISARPGQGGRVELWPLVPLNEADDDNDDSPWRAPLHNQMQQTAMQQFVESLAQWIRDKIGTIPQPGKTPLKASDILILVSKRSAFIPALIRALKTRSVPVASFLRAKVTEQLAVRDLLTLCATLLLPQDDLSLSSVLTSPFGGVSDSSLMDLITNNKKRILLGKKGRPLWDVLRDRHQERPEWQDIWERLSALYRRVDFDSPFELLMQALGPLGGRSRIFARLGPEASESIDELLSMALTYESEYAPSLQGFLQWVEESAIETRREAETVSDEVRIMTVHGAKGLQARMVILPDTTSSPREEADLLWPHYSGQSYPFWVPRAPMATDSINEMRSQLKKRAEDESHRLLYVALTRASDMLIICGWEKKRAPKKALGIIYAKRLLKG